MIVKRVHIKGFIWECKMRHLIKTLTRTVYNIYILNFNATCMCHICIPKTSVKIYIDKHSTKLSYESQRWLPFQAPDSTKKASHYSFYSLGPTPSSSTLKASSYPLQTHQPIFFLLNPPFAHKTLSFPRNYFFS